MLPVTFLRKSKHQQILSIFTGGSRIVLDISASQKRDGRRGIMPGDFAGEIVAVPYYIPAGVVNEDCPGRGL